MVDRLKLSLFLSVPRILSVTCFLSRVTPFPNKFLTFLTPPFPLKRQVIKKRHKDKNFSTIVTENNNLGFPENVKSNAK